MWTYLKSFRSVKSKRFESSSIFPSYQLQNSIYKNWTFFGKFSQEIFILELLILEAVRASDGPRTKPLGKSTSFAYPRFDWLVIPFLCNKLNKYVIQFLYICIGRKAELIKKSKVAFFIFLRTGPVPPYNIKYKLFYYINSNKVAIYHTSRSSIGWNPYKRIFVVKFVKNFEKNFWKKKHKKWPRHKHKNLKENGNKLRQRIWTP